MDEKDTNNGVEPVVGVPVDFVEDSEDAQDDMFSDSEKAVNAAWEKIRLQQPDKKLPNSFIERNKLYFLSLFDGRPRLQKLFKRIQFINILLALGGLYLLICFLFPTLIQLGYASACYDEGLDYVMKYHKCFEPLELEFSTFDYSKMSRYNVLFQSIDLDYGRELDADISEGNALRDAERAKLGQPRFFDGLDNPVNDWSEVFADLQVKDEEDQLADVEDLNVTGGVESE